MWAEVSSPTPNFLHKGLSGSPSRYCISWWVNRTLITPRCMLRMWKLKYTASQTKEKRISPIHYCGQHKKYCKRSDIQQTIQLDNDREERSPNKIIHWGPTSKPNYELSNILLLLSQYDTITCQEKPSIKYCNNSYGPHYIKWKHTYSQSSTKRILTFWHLMSTIVVVLHR